MAAWGCRDRPRRILDPALGRGVFVEAVEALLREGPAPRGRAKRRPTARGVQSEAPRIDVCEIDADMLRQFVAARRKRPGQRAGRSQPILESTAARPCLTIRHRRVDFITASFRRQYDAVIANPPYVRHHDMHYDEAVLAGFDRICRRRLSRLTNLYGLFLIKIWTLLAEGGRAAVITPAEWLNADFGVGLKAYLLEENAIEAIVHFDRAANVFDGALTTAAITLLRRGRKVDETVGLCHVRSIGQLSHVTVDEKASRSAVRAHSGTHRAPNSALDPQPPTLSRRVSRAELDPRAKWSSLFTQSERDSASPHRRSAIRGPSGTGFPAGQVGRSSRAPHCTLADVARCTRGIATGANDYFALRESDRRKWNIDHSDVVPCITKARQVARNAFTGADVQRLIDTDQRIWLLSPRRRLSAAVLRYLEEGRRRGIDKRYLPSHRPVWYRPEHREPAPILVSVFTRGAFRFVLNQARALNLTAYHAIYLHDSTSARIRALFDHLRGDEARRALEHHRRIYADGLLKLEPRDVEALPIPDELRHKCRDR